MVKKILLVIGLLLLLIVAATTTLVIRPDLLRGAIASGAQRFAGLDLHIADIQSHTSPVRLEIRGVKLANPSWPEPKLLSLEHLTLTLSEVPFGEKPFWSLSGGGLDVRVAKNRDGELNWLTGKLQGSDEQEPPAESGLPQLPGDFSFNKITLQDISISYRSPDNEDLQIVIPEVRGERLEHGNGELELRLRYREQAFALRGKIDLFDPAQGIVDYRVALEHSDLDLSSEGRLVLNPNLQDSDLRAELALRRVDRLASLAQVELPDLLAIKASTQLTITPDYEFSELTLAVGENQLTGGATLSPDASRIDAKLSSQSLALDPLIALFAPPAETDTSTAQTNTAAAKPVASNEAEMDWTWLSKQTVNAELAVAKLSAQGWNISGLKMNTRLDKAIHLDLAAKTIHEEASGRDIPDFTSKLVITPLAAQTQGADADIDLAITQSDLKVNASGKVNLNGTSDNSLKLTASAPRSADLWALGLLPWQEAGALKIDATIDSPSSKEYTVDAQLGLGEQRAEFDLRFNPAIDDGATAQLNGDIALSKISLAFMNEVAAGEVVNTEPAPAPAGDGKVLSNEPLPFDAMKQLDAKLNITLTSIDTGHLLISKATFQPTLNKGHLKLPSTRISVPEGEAYIDLDIDASKTSPQIATSIKIDSSNYGKLGLDKAAGIKKGHGKIRVDLRANGSSPRQLAASASGRVDMKVKDLVAKGNALNLIGSDVLSATIDKLNPFREKRTTTKLECVATHFKGENGRFYTKNGIAVETKETKIIGTGSLDFRDEELLFSVTPIARTGVGVNVGAAAGLVRLAGSFSKPKVEADPAGMFTSGLSTGAALYTGGLSILAQGLIKRALYSGSACDGELDEIPAAEEIPEELLNPPQPAADAQATEAAGNEANSAGADNSPAP